MSPTYDDLKARLAEVEAIMRAFRNGEVDAVLGEERITLLRLRETEQVLRDSEARFKSVFADAPTGVALLGTDGRFLQANRPLGEMLGYMEHELLDTSLQALMHPDDNGSSGEMLQRLLAGKRRVCHMELRYVHRLGHTVWARVSISLVHGTHGNPPYFIFQAQDVTRHKRAEWEILLSKQEVETAYEELQITTEQLRTTNAEILQHINVKDLRHTNADLERANADLRRTNADLQCTNANLQHANACEAILTHLPIGVVVVDCKLNVLFWNRRAERLWGLWAEEVQGQFFLDLDIGLPLEPLRDALYACLREGHTHQEIVREATGRLGQTISCRVMYTPLIDAKRERQGVILCMEETGNGLRQKNDA